MKDKYNCRIQQMDFWYIKRKQYLNFVLYFFTNNHTYKYYEKNDILELRKE